MALGQGIDGDHKLVAVAQAYFDDGHVEVLLFFFGLVDLDVPLHALDQGIVQFVDVDGLLGDLAQRDHGVLVVVALDRERRTGRDVARTLRGHHHQIETVGNLKDTVFNCYAGHLRQSSENN